MFKQLINTYVIMMNQKNKNTYIQYLGFNNQYVWALSQPLPSARFYFNKDISMFTQDFVINYNKNINLGYTLIFGVEYPEYLL